MDFRQWETVVVEWVNCLKLTKPVTCLNDLNDGLFLTSLVKLLTQDDSKSTKCLSIILKFLKDQYPNVILEYLNDLHFQDLPENDTLIISSLLLHYSCIFDRRDVLTSPLCHNLSQTTQICIRAFLENVGNQITRDELFHTINRCINKDIRSKSMRSYDLQAGDSLLICRSPLEDLLQTPPIKTGRLQEKDREINKLRHEVDLERFEKADLHDELSVQKQRNKKLSQKMSAKTQEIAKLRSEIADLENKSLQYCQDDESRELQRRLRGEIDSMEKYITQLQIEQDQLYGERDSIKDRLRKVEGQCIIWHDKAVTTEQNYDNLLEKHQEQEQDVQNLRSQCIELSALLEELRTTKRFNDSYLEVDTSLLESSHRTIDAESSCEDLACAVVEVQLRDAHKENNELKNLLKDSQESARKLNEELNTVKSNLTELQTDYEILKFDNNDLLEKVSVLTETEASLQHARQKLEKSAEQLSEILQENTFLNSNIVSLQNQIYSSKITLTELESSNQSVSMDLATLETKYAESEVTLNQKIESCNALEERVSLIQSDYDILLSNYNTTNFSLQSVTKNFNQLESNMEQSLQKLEKSVFGSNTIDFKNKASAFEQVFKQLAENHLQQLQEKKVMADNLSNYEELISKLQTNLVQLNEKDAINLQERQILSSNLKCAEQHISILENTIQEHLEKIRSLNCTISEMTTTITDLEMLKEVVERKENIIFDLQAASNSLETKLTESNEELAQSKVVQEDLRKSLESLERIKSDFEMKITETEKELAEHKENEDKLSKTIAELHALTSVFETQIAETTEELTKSKQNEKHLQQTLENLQGSKTALDHQLYEANNKISRQKSRESLLEKNIFDQEKQYQENIRALNVEIEGYNTKVNELEMELQGCNLNYAAAQRDLEIILNSKQELQEEIESCRNSFEKRVNILDATINKLGENLRTAIQEKGNLEEKLDKKILECENLKLSRDQSMSQYIAVEHQLEETLKMLALQESECKEKDNLLSKTNQNLLIIKLDVEQKNESLKILQADITERDLKIQRLAERIVSMGNKQEELRYNITELQSEYSILDNLKTTLETKCNELESNAWKIVAELSSKNEELESLMEKYIHYKEKTESELLNFNIALTKSQSELEDLTEMKNTLVSENKKQIDDLQDKIFHLNKVIESLNNREMQHLEELRNTKDELSDTVMRYTESLQIRQEMEAENEIQVNNLTENLHELIEKYNNLDKTLTENILDLKNNQEQVEVLENCKIELEAKLFEQEAKYEVECNSCTTRLNMQITELAQRKCDLKNELFKITDKLKLADKNNEDLNDKFREVCSELAQLKSQKFELSVKLNEFKNSYQEIKSIYGSLKLTHLQFVEENCENFSKLQSELSQQIGYLVEENGKLKNTITDLQENITVLWAEQEVINVLHSNKLEQKEEVLNELENDNETCRQHINNLLEEKSVIQVEIVAERKQLKECKAELMENKAVIEEHQINITKLKCANDILETGKGILQDEIDLINGTIEELEKDKLDDATRFTAEIDSREDEIKSLKEKIEVLQVHLSENSTKNCELMLELCTVNESLESLTKQHCKLQQVLTEEKQAFTKQLLQTESETNNKQNFLESLQTENKMLCQEISMAKKEIEHQKGKLKIQLMERQALELEINTINEKLLGQDSVVRRQEVVISEANGKILGKLEEILELEKEKRTLKEKLEELCIELDKVRRNRDEILESQAKVIKETENNLIRAHENAIEVKNDLLKRIELVENEKINERQLRGDLEKLLEGEKVAKEILEIRVLELANEKAKFSQLFSILKHNVQSLNCVLAEKSVEIFADGERKELYMGDLEYLNSNIEMVKGRILEITEQKNVCSKQVLTLENEKAEIIEKIGQITYEKEMIVQENEQLIKDYNVLSGEKAEREQDFLRVKDAQIAHDILKAKYEQLMKYSKGNESANLKNTELQEKIAHLEKKTAEAYNTYKKYAGYSTTYKAAIEKLITERNVLEGVLNNLKQTLSSIHMKMLRIADEREHSRLTEQVQSFEFITEDIQKQFLRISRKIHEIILMIVQVPADIYSIVSSEKLAGVEDVFDKIDFDEEFEKVVDCRDRATDLLEQMSTFEGSLSMKTTKIQKENILRTSNTANVEVKPKDEELKKKNTMLKQRLTLAENAKGNLEKKIKQLRQENKILNSRSDSIDNDISYKTLLQQHIQAKEEYEKTLSDCKAQYNKLVQEHENYKAKNKFIPEQIKYEKAMKTEQDVKLEKELVKLREAYGNVMSDNSKLDLENATMRKLLDDRTSQLSELKVIKESYEKLLEENNKLRMEVDTVKYKRNRDREALLEALKKDKNESKKIQEVRNEYEGKLEKMKDKMVQLYREEIDKEVQKHQKDQNERVVLLKTIDQLKNNLKDQKSKSEKICEFCTSQSFFTMPDAGQTCNSVYQVARLQEGVSLRGSGDSVSERNSISHKKVPDDRKYATLPRSVGMSVIEENAVLKRNTLSSVPPGLGQNLEMEDEDEDFFNNKYLADLKEGRCVIPSGRESNVSRLSELKWRNSMCPPHLKSSYPAETQFNSPGQFKEDDIKTGTTDFDDSMSTRLIPGEKPRKKDIGTTSYKKPGPPTPSKNGGRVSLQGNEPHPRDVLREQNESKTPKRMTPSRLKALFMGRNSSVRDNSENLPGTPRSKRLSIFRKPK